MTEAQKKKKSLARKEHRIKLKKVKEVLQLLSKRSGFFATIRAQIKNKKTVRKNVLDVMYKMVMNMTFDGQRS